LRLKLTYYIFIISCIIFNSYNSVYSQYYTGSNIQFGQNRVQYNTFFWQSYNFERFKVHFSDGGQKHAVYTAKAAHKYLKELEKFFDYETTEKIHFIVYNSLSKFRQSNIGLTSNINSNIGGTTKIGKNKIFLYYEGDHEKFNRQIKAGLAELLINRILVGDNWRQSLKNASILHVPDWFKQGLIKYLEGPWTTEIDNEVKDLVLDGKIENFNKLNNNEQIIAGRAIWNYIEQVYGAKMIPNLLYMTKVSNNIETGFIFVLGSTLANFTNDFVKFYKQRYSVDKLDRNIPKFEEIKIKSRKNRIYRQFKISPNGKYAAYTTNKLGQYKVFVYDIQKNKTRRIAKGNYKLNRIPDYSQPNLAWHPTSKVLAFIEDKKGDLILNLYDINDKKKNKKKLLHIEKVLSLEYSKSGKDMIFSAVKEGQTDIYLYNVIGNSQKQLTNDLYDDLHPSFISNNRIIFSSNREDNTNKRSSNISIITNDFDIYVMNIYNKSKLDRITNTPFANEKFPTSYNGKSYTYLSDKNGIYNRYISAYDSTISHIDTSIHYRYFSTEHYLSNYHRNILELNHHSIKDFSTLYKINGKYHFFISSIKDESIFNDKISNTTFVKAITKAKKSKKPTKINVNKKEQNDDNNLLDINNYVFEKELNIEKNISKQKDTTKVPHTSNKNTSYELPTQKIYKVNFSIEEITMQLNPIFNNQSYPRFSGSGFQNSGFDSFTLISAFDVFEDYRITGGLKGPIQIDNTGYVLTYENLKSRLDKKYLLSRQSYQQLNDDFDIQKIVSYDVKYILSYPFSEVNRLQLSNHVRYDRKVTLSTEPNTLLQDNENFYLAGAVLEFVHDETRPIALNIQLGTKYKLWAEAYKDISTQNSDFFVLGFDLRHYQKIHRNIIFASRFAASTSFGSQRLIYYMGGVDSWMWAKFDQSILPDPSQNYQFQTIATPLRGFFQNARNGNSFIALNNELRIPLISYFSATPLKSEFLENFMLMGFGDMGTAWTGLNPYSTENSFNTREINGHNYTITIKNQKEPVIYGYGFGLRSKLFGYYVRFDWAWGIDDGVTMPSVKYLSLSLDF